MTGDPASLGLVLGLDFGSARTGVAITDATGTIATPLPHVEKANSQPGLDQLAAIAREHGATRVVVGLPTGLGGGDTPQTARARSFADRVRRALELPVELYDERFTTKLADTTAAASGSATSRDSLAACHLLTAWLAAAGRS